MWMSYLAWVWLQWFCLSWACLVAHEFGHFLVGWKSGIPVSHMELGCGGKAPWLKFQFRGQNIRFWHWPIDGVVHVLRSKKKLRFLFMIAAGPIAETIMLIYLWHAGFVEFVTLTIFSNLMVGWRSDAALFRKRWLEYMQPALTVTPVVVESVQTIDTACMVRAEFDLDSYRDQRHTAQMLRARRRARMRPGY